MDLASNIEIEFNFIKTMILKIKQKIIYEIDGVINLGIINYY